MDKIRLQEESKGSGRYVFTFGRGHDGELGNGGRAQTELVPFRVTGVPEPIQVSNGGCFSMVLSANGEVYGFGKAEHSRYGTPQRTNRPMRIPNLRAITQIACGYWHSLALDSSGTIWCTGYNKHGQLGLGDTVARQWFVQGPSGFSRINAGGHVSLAQQADTGWLFGAGHRLKNGSGAPQANFTQLGIPDPVVSFEAGMMHCGAVDAAGRLYTWGNGQFGQLGHNDRKDRARPKLVRALENVTAAQVSVTWGEKYCHTACVDSDRNVWVWGSGYKGKLGCDPHWSHEDPADRLTPTIIGGDFKADFVACGGIHMAALSEGRVYTWGCGSDGRLGHPEAESHRYLYKEPVPRVIESLGSHNIIGISCCYYHCIVVSG